MKKIVTPVLKILMIATLILAACKKTDPASLNTAPIANAGKDNTILIFNESLLLVGDASIDKENNITSYSWKLISGPVTGLIMVKISEAKTIVKNVSKAGPYQFELTVTDIGGLSSKDTLNILVQVPPNPQPGLIKVSGDTTVSLPYNRALLQIIEGNFQYVSFGWKHISGPFYSIIHTPNLEKTLVSGLVPGVYQFEITATHWNKLTEKDTMTVTVLPDKNFYTKEKLIENLSWICDWGCVAQIILPVTQHFKIYFLKDAISDWEILSPYHPNKPGLFDGTYYLHDDYRMEIQVIDANIDSKIKIVY